MKLSFFFLLVAIIGFFMTAHVNGLQKRQESDGADDEMMPEGNIPRDGPDDQTR